MSTLFSLQSSTLQQSRLRSSAKEANSVNEIVSYIYHVRSKLQKTVQWHQMESTLAVFLYSVRGCWDCVP